MKLVCAFAACLLCFQVSAFASAVTRPDLFHFRNGLWINLHHYLYASALAQTKSGSPRLVTTAQKALAAAPCSALNGEQRQAWQRAVDYYSEHYATRDVLFDDELVKINDALGDTPDGAKTLPNALPTPLKAILAAVAPAYQQACWPAHRQLNEKWIARIHLLLDAHGTAMANRLADIYQTEWPAPPVEVDAVTYSNWAGAYTTTNPPHITFSSTNSGLDEDSGDLELETIFHESSHVLIEKKFDGQLKAAFARYHHEPPQGLDHVIIFFTAGFVTQKELAASNPHYEPFAYRAGIYKRDKYWSEDEAALRQDWQPYLEGRRPLAQALDGLAKTIDCCEATKR